MTRTVALFEFMPYGAPELQSVARPYMIRALLLSALLGALLFAAAGVAKLVVGEASPPPPRAVILLDRIPPPPPIVSAESVAPVAPAAPRRVAAGVALPVPDDQASPLTVPASQDELRTLVPGTMGTGDAPLVVEPSAPDPGLPSRGEYVYYEELPEPVRTVTPDYPGLAREAGVSGRVVVHVLVGRDGRVLDAVVDEGRNVPLLNAAALAAARQYVFKPALASGRPVVVWVTLPFDFRLY